MQKQKITRTIYEVTGNVYQMIFESEDKTSAKFLCELKYYTTQDEKCSIYNARKVAREQYPDDTFIYVSNLKVLVKRYEMPLETFVQCGTCIEITGEKEEANNEAN